MGFPPTPAGSTTGPAGGDLTGTYPNPTVGSGKITAAKIASGVIPTALVDPLAVALGLKNWNAGPVSAGANSALTSQTIYAVALWLPAGLSITGVLLNAAIAAAGTKPTGFFVGLASDNAGTRTMRAQSADISGAAGVPFAATGGTQCAFSAAYTTSAADSPNGLYYVVMLQNGSYGTTQPTFYRGAGGAPTTTLLAYATGGTGQTALPANGNTITLATTGTPLCIDVAAY